MLGSPAASSMVRVVGSGVRALGHAPGEHQRRERADGRQPGAPRRTPRPAALPSRARGDERPSSRRPAPSRTCRPSNSVLGVGAQHEQARASDHEQQRPRPPRRGAGSRPPGRARRTGGRPRPGTRPRRTPPPAAASTPKSTDVGLSHEVTGSPARLPSGIAAGGDATESGGEEERRRRSTRGRTRCRTAGGGRPAGWACGSRTPAPRSTMPERDEGDGDPGGRDHGLEHRREARPGDDEDEDQPDVVGLPHRRHRVVHQRPWPGPRVPVPGDQVPDAGAEVGAAAAGVRGHQRAGAPGRPGRRWSRRDLVPLGACWRMSGAAPSRASLGVLACRQRTSSAAARRGTPRRSARRPRRGSRRRSRSGRR